MEAIIAVILLTVVILSVMTILVCTYTEGKHCFGEQGDSAARPKTFAMNASTVVLKKPGVSNPNAAASISKVQPAAGKSLFKTCSSKASKKMTKSKKEGSKSRNSKFSSAREK